MNGWPIVGWATLAVVAVVGAIFALAASALRRRWPMPATTWLLRNRRQLGVSFAVSHLIHLIAIAALAGWTWAGFLANTPTITLVAGGLAYVFIALMTLTSFDRTAAWLGSRRWRLLHTVGAYYVWIIFAQNFFVQAFKSAFYWPYAALLAGAMVLRWWPAARAADLRVGVSGRAA